jgi:hypothetical protein
MESPQDDFAFREAVEAAVRAVGEFALAENPCPPSFRADAAAPSVNEPAGVLRTSASDGMAPATHPVR